MTDAVTKNRHRTIFISDIHLGTRGCQAERLLEFLKTNTANTIYLVGDIIDLWSLSRSIYFPQSHVNVLKKFLTLSKKHKVVYIRGNHDNALDQFVPFNLGNIEIVMDAVHRTADGKEIYVVHGDKYDQVMKHAKWLAYVGDIGYQLLLKSNWYINIIRKRFGLKYWSFSAYMKHKVKGAVNFIGNFEQAVTQDAIDNGFDGVLTGHIHFCEIKSQNGILYMNSGDWVESCTAIVEDFDGNFTQIEFLERIV